MKSMAGLEIYAYWDTLRGNKPAPRREDFDPTKLKHHLGDLFILVDKGERTPFFRLAGTHLCDLFGRELRDSPFSDLWPAASATFPCRVARGILQHQLPVVFDIEAEDDHGAASLAFEMLLLPLSSDNDTAPRLLGALLPERPPSRIRSTDQLPRHEKQPPATHGYRADNVFYECANRCHAACGNPLTAASHPAC